MRNMEKPSLVKIPGNFFRAEPLPAGYEIICAGRAVNHIDFSMEREEIRRAEKKILSSVTGLLPERILSLEQVHGDEIVTVEKVPDMDLPFYGTADAFITDVPGICTVIRTADCVPVIILDPDRPACAAVHSGWKGCRLGISGKTVKKMADVYGSVPEHLMAYILPSIGPEVYEVSRDVADFFPEQTVSRNGKLYVDLWASAAASLEAAGLEPGNIFCFRICSRTHCDEFFSHRAGDAGRNLNAVRIL